MNSICLDSCAGESIFRHKPLFKHKRVSDNPLIVRGMNDSSKPMIVTLEGDTQFGRVHFSENCVANVLSLGTVVGKCYKIIDDEISDQFLLQVICESDVFVFSRSVNTNTFVCDLGTDIFESTYMSQYSPKYVRLNRIVLASTV